MGLFKDFKEDFSQAVNEMMPGNETSAKIRQTEKSEEDKILMNNAALLNNNISMPEPQQVAPTITPSTPINSVNPGAVADETSVITAGTVLTGDLASDGSFDIQGTINGNISCNCKLVIT